ncbi:VOC family protein [Dactylosporangium sp. NPDC048998]|uniref:VOC family protein n=1 Tax=Dactylosporangium sp. NPDC048998 TaxID=3363976 RepID=UPI00371CFFCB
MTTVTVHHVALSAADLSRSGAFYDVLLGELGYRREHTSDELLVWAGPGPEILVYPVEGDDATPHTHGRPGLQHLALRVDATAVVDAVDRAVGAAGGAIVHPPRRYPEYPFPGYYAVFCADPDGSRIEILYHTEPTG